MAILTPVSDNVYNISYADDQFNPLETKMGEGTTGQKYASNYMGARSRWWDMSWRQAELEAQGIAATNKKINDEILMLKDARANIIQGIPQRYDSMYKHHNLQEQKRKEWNASAGDMWSTTYGLPGGSGSGTRGGAGRSQAIRIQVQEAIEAAPNADASSAMLGVYRNTGKLGKDEPSQDQTAWFAVQIRSQDRMNTMMNADASLTKEAAATQAEADVLAEFEGSQTGKDIAKRYKRQRDEVVKKGTAKLEKRSATYRKGKKEIDPYRGTSLQFEDKPDKDAEGVTAVSRLLDNGGKGFNPWVHAEETEISRIDDEVLALEKKLQSVPDTIGRTREIQRDKFGPSILGSIREMIGTGYGKQQQEGYSALNEYLTKAQEAGTLEQALAELRGLPVPPKPMDWNDPSVKLRREYAGEPPMFIGLRATRGDGKSLSIPYGSERYKRIEALGKIPPLPEGPPKRRTEDPFEFDPESTDVAKARDALEAAEKRYDEAQMSLLGTHTRDGDPTALGGPSTAGDKQEMEDADTHLRAVRAWAESIGAAKKTGAEESLKRTSTEAKSEEVPEEKGDGEAALLEGMGNDEVVANRRGLLKAFSGAGELLGKQKKMKRKVANASAGSPEAYAAASMQAWRSQTPEQRSTLSDMISQTATEFNSMDDPKGAEEASKWLTALYAQETGLNLLKG
tara:strand:- start:8768 stop:10813 length:2046 start_codon:yes stop_codon:yes gene_type:complete